MNDLILYTTEDGRSQIKLRAKDQTVWLSQRGMAQLFDVSTDNVGLHLKNIFEDGELIREATTEESSVVQIEGGREVQRPLLLYNLDAIHERMEERTGELYLEFDQNRKKLEALQADQQDEADLKTLEAKLKRRPKK